MDEHITIPGGVFIVFEGPDGAGKSTQIRLLAESLKSLGYHVALTREPGGTRIGEEIRKLLHNPDYTEMQALTELFLFSGDRAQHTLQVVGPALKNGKIVLGDRSVISTLAYQGFGGGRDMEEILALSRIACGQFFRIDLVIYLDVPVEIGLARRQAAAALGKEFTRIDAQAIAYHERVRQGYLEMASWEPEVFGQFSTLDATTSIEALHKQILVVVLPFLKKIIIGGGIQRDFAKI